MSDTPSTAPPVVWRPDGNIWLRMESGTVKLRKPKVRELRSMLDALSDLTDENTDAITTLRHRQAIWQATEDASTAVLADADADPLARDEAESALRDTVTEVRKAARVASAQLDDAVLGWVRDALVLLAIDGHVPDDAGDFDGFMGQYAFALALKEHWETVPLRSGG